MFSLIRILFPLGNTRGDTYDEQSSNVDDYDDDYDDEYNPVRKMTVQYTTKSEGVEDLQKLNLAKKCHIFDD